jgi:ABC-type branched-subunit amino acid transport system ATPase component
MPSVRFSARSSPRLAGANSAFLAVDRVNLVVNEGELLAIVGPSGCGKWTFLNTVDGRQAPDRGGGRQLVEAQTGVGLMMAKAGATFKTAKVFAGLIIAAGPGFIAAGSLQRIERSFQDLEPPKQRLQRNRINSRLHAADFRRGL